MISYQNPLLVFLIILVIPDLTRRAGLYCSNPKEVRYERFYWSIPITLTPVFSKMYKGFLANWLKAEILELIDLQ